MTPPRDHRQWWCTAVVYQVYIRSFADGNGDGVGDLAGIRSRLPHLVDLGVDGIWITPFYRSPMADHGYDVADPRDVDPSFGDLASFDALVADAHAAGLKVTIDVVPNHTSDRHRWFQQALAAGPGSPERARYVFRDGRGAGGELPPNNWVSTFGGPAWTRVPDGQWYLHLFAPEQPDLDWSNPEVFADFERTLRFWLDRGVDGFRIDVAHGLAKPSGLPDMTDPRNFDHMDVDRIPERDIRFDDDGVHDHWRATRAVLDGYGPDRMAVGEIWVRDDERLARYVRPDELHLAFNFRLAQARWTAASLRAAIDDSTRAMRAVGAPTTWVLSNHDVRRHVSRYGGGPLGVRRARAAALLQLALPGVAYVYNGDELGLPNVDDLPADARRDPVWFRTGGAEPGRDGCRIPLPWSGSEPPYGFSPDAVPTWLPQPAGWEPLTVAAQHDDPDSMLALYRAALALRRRLTAEQAEGTAGGTAELRWLAAPDGCLHFARDLGPYGTWHCLVNLSTVSLPVPPGELLLCSVALDGELLPTDAAAWVRTPNP